MGTYSHQLFLSLFVLSHALSTTHTAASGISSLFMGGLGSLYMTVAFRFANVGDFLPMKAL